MPAQTTRKVFQVGRIAPKRYDGARPCTNGCAGPFLPRPEMTEWLREMLIESGLPTAALLPQYQCQTCGTDRGFSRRELRRAS